MNNISPYPTAETMLELAKACEKLGKALHAKPTLMGKLRYKWNWFLIAHPKLVKLYLKLRPIVATKKVNHQFTFQNPRP